MIKVGVIGCGKIAQVRHLPEYAQNPDAKIYGIFDLDTGRAKKIADEYGAKIFESYEAMLAEPEIDAVSVCTANHSHCEITVAALEAGKHVLCEKPMAITYEQCKKMVETAGRTGKYLMVGHNQRFAKAHVRAKSLVEQGVIGDIITFRSNFGHSGPETWAIDKNNVWFFDKNTAAFGAMADLGIHKTDLIQFLMGSEIDEVTAILDTLDKKMPDGKRIGVDDNAICIYKLKNGVLGTMTASWSYYGKEDNSTVLYGTKGCMKIYDDTDYSIVIEGKGGEEIYYKIDTMQTNDNQSDSGIIDHWIKSLIEKKEPDISGEDAFCAMKAVFAALQSAKKKKTVKVSELW